jgi:hypothetical protein
MCCFLFRATRPTNPIPAVEVMTINMLHFPRHPTHWHSKPVLSVYCARRIVLSISLLKKPGRSVTSKSFRLTDSNR